MSVQSNNIALKDAILQTSIIKAKKILQKTISLDYEFAIENSKEPCTFLELAVKKNFAQVIPLLLKKRVVFVRADVLKKHVKICPLNNVLLDQQTDCVREFLVNYQYIPQASLDMFVGKCFAKAKEEWIEMVLQNQIKFDAQLLVTVVKKNQASIIELIEKCVPEILASTMHEDVHLWTVAACEGHVAMYNKLVQYATEEVRKTDNLVVHYLKSKANDGSVQVVQEMMEQGFSLLPQTCESETVLHVVKSIEQVEFIYPLVSHTIGLEQRTSADYTPLMCACLAGREDVLEYYLNVGTDIETKAKETYQNALTLAIESKSAACIELLLNHHANVNVFYQPDKQFTYPFCFSYPIIYAVQQDLYNIAELLLNSPSINMNVTTRHGRSVFSSTNPKMLQLVASKGAPWDCISVTDAKSVYKTLALFDKVEVLQSWLNCGVPVDPNQLKLCYGYNCASIRFLRFAKLTLYDGCTNKPLSTHPRYVCNFAPIPHIMHHFGASHLELNKYRLDHDEQLGIAENVQHQVMVIWHTPFVHNRTFKQGRLYHADLCVVCR